MGKGKECSIMQKHMEKPNTGPYLQVDFEKNVCWLLRRKKQAMKCFCEKTQSKLDSQNTSVRYMTYVIIFLKKEKKKVKAGKSTL